MNMKVFLESLTKFELFQLYDELSKTNDLDDFKSFKEERKQNITIEEFFYKCKEDLFMSVRLQQAFMSCIKNDNVKNKKLIDINYTDIAEGNRNFGQKSYAEFDELRRNFLKC